MVKLCVAVCASCHLYRQTNQFDTIANLLHIGTLAQSTSSTNSYLGRVKEDAAIEDTSEGDPSWYDRFDPACLKEILDNNSSSRRWFHISLKEERQFQRRHYQLRDQVGRGIVHAFVPILSSMCSCCTYYRFEWKILDITLVGALYTLSCKTSSIHLATLLKVT